MRIVFMGSSEFSVPSLHRLMESEHTLVAVYTSPDRPAGRGQRLVPPIIKEVAVRRGIPVFQPERLGDQAESERWAALSPDIIIVVAYGKLLPRPILNLPPFGCLNIHPSLLPRYRGPSPIAAAILSGDRETGVTLMLLDEGMDTGPILAQKKVSIHPADTTESLGIRLAHAGAELLMESLPHWFARRLQPIPQVESKATYTALITKKDGEIDWRLSAEEIDRQIRAFYPWPGGYTYWEGRILKIIEAVPLSEKVGGTPGTVMALPSRSDIPIGVITGSGVLGLRRIQLEGKRETSSDEFVRGHRGFEGARLGKRSRDSFLRHPPSHMSNSGTFSVSE